MRVFISAEAHVSAGEIIATHQRAIEGKLGQIEISDYTDDFDTMGIITNCFDDEWMRMGFGKVRKYIGYKSRNADIRLNIPYDDFMQADEHCRYLMVVKNIVDSIDVVGERTQKSKRAVFDSERMVNDILAKLSLTREDLINI